MLRLMIEMQEPPKPKKEEYSRYKIPVEDRVRDALENIDSGKESYRDWLFIKGLYDKLCSKEKPNKRVINLIKMIEPILAKYGYHHKAER